MIRGLYTSASGMMTQMTIQDVVSNNLANVDTTGYKKDTTVSRAFQSLLLNRIGDRSDRGMDVRVGPLGTGVILDGTYTDFSMGSFKPTENKFDLALGSEGFFVVQTPQGERYTRDGSFTLASNGDLVTKDGYQVVGNRGTINLAGAVNILVNEDGSVAVDGRVINQLRVVNAQPQALDKIGSNLFALRTGSEAEESSNFRVLQGFLETSNVNVVSEMVKMISGLRLYEANQKAIRSQDGTLERLINDVPRL
jgi:flagellar basal-body rod protein FlgF